MENGPFDDVFSIKNGDPGYAIATLVYQKVPYIPSLSGVDPSASQFSFEWYLDI